jgi:hypothetical protein
VTRILVVWEDTYFQPMATIVNHAVTARRAAEDVATPRVLGHTTRSNTAFDRYVSTSWPNASVRGLPMDPGPIAHCVCVVDGDKLARLLPDAIPQPPRDPAGIAQWHATAERAWNEHRRGKNAPDGPAAERVHGVILRWSKESLLLAGYDQAGFAHHLSCHISTHAVAEVLKACTPPLDAVPPAAFSDTFRNPDQCLRSLRQAADREPLAKNAPQIDDALRRLARDSLTTLCARVPDLWRIADLVWQLHRPPASPPDESRPSSDRAPGRHGAKPPPSKRTSAKPRSRS